MLPGPVLVAMVTKTEGWGGFSRDRISLAADWSDAQKYGGRDEAGAMMSHAHRFPDGRIRARASIHRHNGHLFKVGLS